MSESDCSGEWRAALQFNLADLFEAVADAVPDRDAGGVRRRTAELRGARRAHRPGSRTLLAARGVQPGEHVALYMRNSIEHLEAMLACYKLRAVPINVNYRYVDDELAYLLADADAVALVHDAEVRARARTRRPDVDAVRFALDVDDPVVGGRARGRVDGARSRPPLPRRPLRALHGRDDRHAEGRGVAARGHLLLGDGRREPRRPADRTARARSRVRSSTTPRNASGRSWPRATPDRRSSCRSRSVRSCTRAVSGRRSGRCSAAARSCCTTSRTSTWNTCSISSSASR